jgi:hypothetical protein
LCRADSHGGRLHSVEGERVSGQECRACRASDYAEWISPGTILPSYGAAGVFAVSMNVLGAILLKLSRLHHIVQTIDIEPVADGVEDADRLFTCEQFLNQVRDRGFAVAGLCEQFGDDGSDER